MIRSVKYREPVIKNTAIASNTAFAASVGREEFMIRAWATLKSKRATISARMASIKVPATARRPTVCPA
jgi:hypothetical protein